MLLNDQAFDYVQSVEINNIPTELVCHKFQNKIFLLVSIFVSIIIVEFIFQLIEIILF